jgi:hypothetical protein
MKEQIAFLEDYYKFFSRTNKSIQKFVEVAQKTLVDSG